MYSAQEAGPVSASATATAWAHWLASEMEMDWAETAPELETARAWAMDSGLESAP
jgi:hypothetical protein